MLAMDTEALERFIDRQFPQARALGFSIEVLDESGVTLGLLASQGHLRPGGTVSGPTMMALADTAAYLAILSRIGPVALAVTTNLNIHFMRKPGPGMLYGRATMLKLGKRMAVCEVRLYGDDPQALYAHATVTYSIPPAH